MIYTEQIEVLFRSGRTRDDATQGHTFIGEGDILAEESICTGGSLYHYQGRNRVVRWASRQFAHVKEDRIILDGGSIVDSTRHGQWTPRERRDDRG